MLALHTRGTHNCYILAPPHYPLFPGSACWGVNNISILNFKWGCLGKPAQLFSRHQTKGLLDCGSFQIASTSFHVLSWAAYVVFCEYVSRNLRHFAKLRKRLQKKHFLLTLSFWWPWEHNSANVRDAHVSSPQIALVSAFHAAWEKLCYVLDLAHLG